LYKNFGFSLRDRPNGNRLPASEVDGILTIKTEGHASELEYCEALRRLVKDIDGGLESPLINVTPFIKRSSQLERTLLESYKPGDVQMVKQVKVYLLNESKLKPEERSRLYWRRSAYCDTNIFKVMHGKEQYGDFPNLPSLNEYNVDKNPMNPLCE
jgi:hypothetical protein